MWVSYGPAKTKTYTLNTKKPSTINNVPPSTKKPAPQIPLSPGSLQEYLEWTVPQLKEHLRALGIWYACELLGGSRDLVGSVKGALRG